MSHVTQGDWAHTHHCENVLAKMHVCFKFDIKWHIKCGAISLWQGLGWSWQILSGMENVGLSSFKSKPVEGERLPAPWHSRQKKNELWVNTIILEFLIAQMESPLPNECRGTLFTPNKTLFRKIEDGWEIVVYLL